jgi:hypothetical protein
MARITQAGESGLYHVHFLDARDPGFGVGGLPHPDQGLPGGTPHPGGGPIYHPGHPDHGLPVHPAHPGNRPPGSGHPVFPDNSLPSGPPPTPTPGQVIVLVRDAGGVWHYHSAPAGSVGNPLPPMPTPPIAGTPPGTAGTPLPPTAAPKT